VTRVTRLVGLAFVLGCGPDLPAPQSVAPHVVSPDPRSAAPPAASADGGGNTSGRRDELPRSAAPPEESSAGREAQALALIGASPAHCAALLEALALPTTSTQDVSRTVDVYDALADELPGPVLASAANELRTASAFLLQALAFESVAKAPEVAADARRWLRVARAQLSHTESSAKAQCVEDPSRDQAPAWRTETEEILVRARPSLIACFVTRPSTGDARLTLRTRIGGDGRVLTAGPVRYTPSTSGIPPAAVDCLMTVIESTKFPPPSGIAIIDTSLVPRDAAP
jgi:hypothetical protein